MWKKWKGYGSKAVQAVGALLVVAWSAMFVLCLTTDTTTKDLIMTLQVGGPAVGTGGLLLYLGRNRAILAILLWNLVIAIAFSWLAIFEFYDLAVAAAGLYAILSGISAVLIVTDRLKASSWLMVVAGVLSLPAGVFSILFGIVLRRIAQDRVVTHSVTTSRPAILAPGQVLCASCGQTFYGQVREDGSCPLCGGPTKPQG